MRSTILSRDYNEEDVYEEGYEVYKKSGQKACEIFAVEHGVKKHAFCVSCERDEPVLSDGTCFICGSPTPQEHK